MLYRISTATLACYFVEFSFFFKTNKTTPQVLCSVANCSDTGCAINDQVAFVGVCTNEIFTGLDWFLLGVLAIFVVRPIIVEDGPWISLRAIIVFWVCFAIVFTVAIFLLMPRKRDFARVSCSFLRIINRWFAIKNENCFVGFERLFLCVEESCGAVLFDYPFVSKIFTVAVN